jgi:hypothetical protein
VEEDEKRTNEDATNSCKKVRMTLCGRLDRINYARAIKYHVQIHLMAKGWDMHNLTLGPLQR